MRRLLLCSDLDRTLLPNGRQPESPQARPLLRRLAARPEVTLVYVSGRDRRLLTEAIEQYDIPLPDYAIGDVGTTLYEIQGDRWQLWQRWSDEIGMDWNGLDQHRLAGLFTDLEPLRLQEPEKQNTWKLSYYAPLGVDRDRLLDEMRQRLERHRVYANLIWSVDEVSGTGLLDLLPASANKLHAIRFLMEQTGATPGDTLFAGDSGNDLEVLTSGLPSILVRNAADEVREAALHGSGSANTLYLARGGFLGMNGNYSAGVLEGVAHFFPAVIDWLTEPETPVSP